MPTNRPLSDALTSDRIAAMLVLTSDVDEIAATLADDDEAMFPGVWAQAGFDRGAVVSEYLAEIDTFQTRS